MPLTSQLRVHSRSPIDHIFVALSAKTAMDTTLWYPCNLAGNALSFSFPSTRGNTEGDVLSDRRGFLKHLPAGVAGSCFPAEPYRSLANTTRKKLKIIDVKCMIARNKN
jgi:hypothetical protein